MSWMSVGIFVFRNFGYNWKSNMTVKGHSVRTRNDEVDLTATLGVGELGRPEDGPLYGERSFLSPGRMLKKSLSRVLDESCADNGVSVTERVLPVAATPLGK
jgi:hypothetical protein